MDSGVDRVAAPADAEGDTLFAGKLWFWVPIAPLVALDLWSKAAVFAFLDSEYGGVPPGHREHRVITEPIGFSLVQWTNTGTIWGLWKDFNIALIAARIVAIPVVIYFARRTPAHKWLQQLMIGLIMAGALGNLYDNLTQPDRAVRDFLKFYWPNPGGEAWVFPAFNVADSCICVGAFVLLFLLLREDLRAARAAKAG